MAGSYKKGFTAVPVPRANPLGTSAKAKGFPHATSPRLAPLKTRIYTKAALGEDPTKFSGSGFGDTGLDETPSIMGMGKNA
jgi:hypothetical protein